MCGGRVFYVLKVKMNFLNFLCTLFHLPPLRFHCVGGCWDQSSEGLAALFKYVLKSYKLFLLPLLLSSSPIVVTQIKLLNR
jgi:hypothetical protein